jgi:hypothetical protein
MEENSSGEAVSSVLPASVPLSLWEEFRKMRVRIRHPMTPYAETLILVKLEKWRLENQADVIAILNESIERGWSGVFLNGHGRGQVVTVPCTASPSAATVCASCGRSLEAGFKYSSKGRLCHGCF